MTSTQLIATIAIASTWAVCALATASDITEFPITTSASTSRAAVKAEARRANDAGLLRYDELGFREAQPKATGQSRDKVRMEAAAATRQRVHSTADSYTFGGM